MILDENEVDSLRGIGDVLDPGFSSPSVATALSAPLAAATGAGAGAGFNADVAIEGGMLASSRKVDAVNPMHL